MTILQEIRADKEIQELQEKLYEATGEKLLFNLDCYFGVEDFKEHLKQCVEKGKIFLRPCDRQAYHRFDRINKDTDTTTH